MYNMKSWAITAVTSLCICAAGTASAETLRLLTWGNYAPEEVINKFEEKYPDIDVEVTLSNNEEMVAKLRATGGAGFDLAQPSHDRVYAAQLEYNIYKPMDLSKINTDNMDPTLLAGVKANTTIDGEVYSVPHQWGTSGLMADKTKAPDVKSWADLCDPKYKGKTSMRLRRTILLGTAFAMGEDPFAAYSDLNKYQEILDKAAEKLIACKDNLKAYWVAGQDLSAMMLSGEVVAAETWDSTAFQLYSENPNIVFVPPETGALAWIDTFTLPRKGEADDAAYKWINFVMQPDIVPLVGGSSGAVTAVKGGVDLMPEDKRAAIKAAFTDEDIANLKFFANIPPGVEDMEGKILDKIKAATGGS
jgi:spermidine/putrescine transport system substrate-binding protein